MGQKQPYPNDEAYTEKKDGCLSKLVGKNKEETLLLEDLKKSNPSNKVLSDDNNIEYDARTAAEELAAATRSEVVQVIGSKFVLYRETHSKPKEKRIQLVKPSVKKKVVKG